MARGKDARALEFPLGRKGSALRSLDPRALSLPIEQVRRERRFAHHMNVLDRGDAGCDGSHPPCKRPSGTDEYGPMLWDRTDGEVRQE